MCIAGKATHHWHHAGMSPGKNRVPVLGSCTTGRARRRLPAPGLGPVGNELVAGTSVFHSQTGLMGPARRSSHDRLQGTKVLTETSAGRPLQPLRAGCWLPQLSVTAGWPLQGQCTQHSPRTPAPGTTRPPTLPVLASHQARLLSRLHEPEGAEIRFQLQTVKPFPGTRAHRGA